MYVPGPAVGFGLRVGGGDVGAALAVALAVTVAVVVTDGLGTAAGASPRMPHAVTTSTASSRLRMPDSPHGACRYIRR